MAQVIQSSKIIEMEVVQQDDPKELKMLLHSWLTSQLSCFCSEIPLSASVSHFPNGCQSGNVHKSHWNEMHEFWDRALLGTDKSRYKWSGTRSLSPFISLVSFWNIWDFLGPSPNFELGETATSDLRAEDVPQMSAHHFSGNSDLSLPFQLF